MASTIGPIDSGIVSALEAQYEKETGVRVRHVGAGTGAALKIGTQCNVDLVMVHAKDLEEKFVADGFGTERIPFMYNDFVIVGPENDPAGIKGMKTAAEALKTIASKGAPFISRGDKSGTNMAELGLWASAGIDPKGPWYTVYEKGSEGNVATLLYTDQKASYTVIDRATFLTVKDKVKIVVLVEGDEALLNHISLIPVNPKKCPRVYEKEALAFVQWLTDPDKGQKIVESFGKDRYGQPLFFPESKAWKARHK
ncbi:MAG TPA: substrate-binding domain-containing protein [Deltaproteobacteria bacterium]|nr:substrate-binding domain-containing protein [Deltaproteobacteria bacterium]HPR55811.1 substrate-binding domain-containing protein [Deltaproteobacteria bacterium]HXK46071.1 substrate-binding domain-containing protein [Deltaproteobacteria bacterium]